MEKLKAIWMIIVSNKFAVFTYENAPSNSEWLTADKFRWNISEKDYYFLDLIEKCLKRIKDNHDNS